MDPEVYSKYLQIKIIISIEMPLCLRWIYERDFIMVQLSSITTQTIHSYMNTCLRIADNHKNTKPHL